jgi:hypothetical protein
MVNISDLKALSDRLSIKQPSSSFDYDDSVRISDLLQNSTNDVQQTYNHIKAGGREDDPIAAPFYRPNNIEAVKALAMAGQTGLVDRWSKMKNSIQKKTEEIMANLIEAGALKYSMDNDKAKKNDIQPFRVSMYATQF